MSKLITPCQKRVLLAINGFRGSRGFSPTIREIGDMLNITSTNGVSDHLRALASKGYIISTPHSARTVLLTTLGLLEVQDEAVKP